MEDVLGIFGRGREEKTEQMVERDVLNCRLVGICGAAYFVT